MDDRTRILVDILADTDAVFIPNRSWNNPRPTVIYEYRRDYQLAGVPWRSEAPDEAGRKAAQRELEALTVAGMVKTFRPKQVKTLGVKLTPAGEALARALCGLPNLERSIGLLLHLALHSDHPEVGATHDGRTWIPETVLAGVTWEQTKDTDARSRLVGVEETLLPALNRVWVCSNSSVQGHVWYSITPAGLAMLEGEHPNPDAPAQLSEEAAGCYLERVQYTLARFDTTAPVDPRDIGEIPLPVAMPRKAG